MTTKDCQEFQYRIEKIEPVFSNLLGRNVDVNVLVPSQFSRQSYPFLLLNDGQDMDGLRLKATVQELVRKLAIPPIILAGVVAADRLQEYGVASKKDYLKRGSQAKAYSTYVTTVLLPFLAKRYPIATNPAQIAIAGCSMGGLSALDIAWNHPHLFGKVGTFSGAFWWRKRSSHSLFYSDYHDRLMHREIRHGSKKENLKFWLQTGALDEMSDRNLNGIIDSIDDTQDLIEELVKKGYKLSQDIHYYEMKNGRHDVETWAEAMPVFLQWAFDE